MKTAKILILISCLLIAVVLALVAVLEAGHGVAGTPALGYTSPLQAVLSFLGENLLYLFLAAGLTVLLAAYFLPTTVALIRHKQNALSIFLLNLFLGWSFVGWVLAIVWAASVDRETA